MECMTDGCRFEAHEDYQVCELCWEYAPRRLREWAREEPGEALSTVIFAARAGRDGLIVSLFRFEDTHKRFLALGQAKGIVRVHTPESRYWAQHRGGRWVWNPPEPSGKLKRAVEAYL